MVDQFNTISYEDLSILYNILNEIPTHIVEHFEELNDLVNICSIVMNDYDECIERGGYDD